MVPVTTCGYILIMPEDALSYRDAGVDIDAAARALRSISDAIRATHNERTIGGIGSFGGLFDASFPEMDRPTLVASIDGVGTKTKVAQMAGVFDHLGADIVNHCVNDILCQGARPLFFLDYFATSRLQQEVFAAVVQGAAEACAAVGCVLIGGETAEMPGVYVDEEIDIVGAIVGIVDYASKLPRAKVQAGDALVGIASDGLHTNGFSLARRALFEIGGYSVRDALPELGGSIADALLRPHRCYFRSVYPLLADFESIRAIAHITGGGLCDNVPRALPSDCQAVIERRSWTPLPIFRLIQDAGNVPDQEMYRTFNMGIGMVLVCGKDVAEAVVQRLNASGEAAAVIGYIQSGPHDVQIA